MNSTKLSVIGFSLDYETGKEKGTGYSNMPHYAIRENYCRAVSSLGALPFPLVHDITLVDAMLDRMDGLVIIGGAFDIHPSHYGEEDVHDTVVLKEARTEFEFAIARGALARNLPVLGICGGQQLLNVVLGGTLIQHVPESFPDSPIQHEQPNPRTEAGHEVAVKHGTLLHKIVGTERLAVNSAHHQAAGKVADGTIINATAADGVIEGIEHPGYRFCLGVQWHPEYHISAGDNKIFEAFVESCRTK